MKAIVLYFSLAVFLCSCATNRMVDGQRHGRWKETYSDGNQEFKSVGRYDHGDEIRRWKYFQGGKKFKVERYRDSVCETTFFHRNGKIASQGITRVVLTEKERHWFYSGDWKHFDETGKLVLIRNYDEGILCSETAF